MAKKIIFLCACVCILGFVIFYFIINNSLSYSVEDEIETALSNPEVKVCLSKVSGKEIYYKLSELQTSYSANKLFLEDSIVFAAEYNIDYVIKNKELFMKPISKIYPIRDDVYTLMIGGIDLAVVCNPSCGKLREIQKIKYSQGLTNSEEQLDIDYRPTLDNAINANYCRSYQVIKDKPHRDWDRISYKRLAAKRYCYKDNQDITVNEPDGSKQDAIKSLQLANTLKNVAMNLILKQQENKGKTDYTCIVHSDSIISKWNKWLEMVSENGRWNDINYKTLIESINNNVVMLLITCSSFNGSEVEVQHVVPLEGINNNEQRTLIDFENYIMYLVRTSSEFGIPVVNGIKANLFKTIIITINKGMLTSIDY